MQLLEQIKRSVNHYLNSYKLLVVSRSKICWAVSPESQRQCDYFSKKLSYLQIFMLTTFAILVAPLRLDIRMNQQIPLNICTNIFDYTTASSNQTLSSALARHLLDNLVCAATYSPTMFTMLERSTNELHLSIIENLLITKYQQVLCNQKQFYVPLLFNTPIGTREENNFFDQFSSHLQAFSMVTPLYLIHLV